MYKPIFYILQWVLVNYFYQINAGFFLFFFFLLFGVVSGEQLVSYHLSLIQGMIESPIFLSCVIFIWFLYTIKCINYITKQLSATRQTFLFTMNTLPKSKQFLYMLWVHFLIYLPVFCYAVVVAVIALKQDLYGSALAVIISNVFMIVFSAWIYTYYLQKRVNILILHIPFIQYTLPKPLFTFPIWFIIKERMQMLLVTKVFSILLLYAFFNLYEPDKPDIRPLLLICMLIVAAHCTIVLQIHLFEQAFLGFTKNLPILVFQRFVAGLLLYFVLLLPELFFIWSGFPVHFQAMDFPQILLLFIALASFFHSLLLMDDMDTDSYFRIVFVICAILFFLLLYNPGISVSLILLVIETVLRE